MPLQLSDAVRHGMLDSIETTVGTAPNLHIFSGAVPANCAAADPAGSLAAFALPSDWLAAASSGTKALAGTWQGTASSGSSTAPASWRIKNTANSAVHMQGTAGVGSGDMNFNGSITSGQTITISTFTISAANS